MTEKGNKDKKVALLDMKEGMDYNNKRQMLKMQERNKKKEDAYGEGADNEEEQVTGTKMI